MPIYESVLQEKPPVVLEIGSAYTKIGFSAEPYPRYILPSRIKNDQVAVSDSTDNQKLNDTLIAFLREIFYKYLLVSPKERKVVIVESVFCPTVFRETLARVLFRHFEVSSLFFAPTHLVVLATLAIDTALVVDIGFRETTVLPVYHGVQVIKAFQAQAYGGNAVHEEIKKGLIESGAKMEFITDDIVENIKACICYVAPKRESTGQSDVDLCMHGKETIRVPGALRTAAMEVFFREDNEHASLACIILDAIRSCPIDMRNDLAGNIVLVGGGSMVPGLLARLKSEILSLLDSDHYKNVLFTKSIGFREAVENQNFSAWLGGAIYGGTDLVLSKSISKEVYYKSGRLPDWIVSK